MTLAGGVRRRHVIAGGGALVVGLWWQPALAQGETKAGGSGDAGQAGNPGAGQGPPGSLKKQPLIDGWIRIAADGGVTVFTGKAELGQGIKTALIQVAAEQLMLPPSRITLVTADTARTADEGYTAGSHSMQDSGTAIRHAAAQVRAILVELAAARLQVPAAQLLLRDGSASAGGRSVGYGELVSGQELHVPAAPQVSLRDPRTHTVAGRALPRVDIPAKVSGGAAYVQDLRLPGMVHGRVVRPPGAAAQLGQLSPSDTARVERMPGVLKVVRDGRFIGVIAQREWQAVQAMRVLAGAVQRALPSAASGAAAGPGPAALPPPERLAASVRAAPSQDFVILDRQTAPGSAPGSAPDSAPDSASRTAPGSVAGKRISATYTRPYQMHGSIGPSCAVAQLEGGLTTVWSHSQGMFPLRQALAEMLAVDKAALRCIHTEGSGCYGHNGADDVAADAALLARALPGRPVRVQWMREDEHAWEPLGPPMVASVDATLDASGAITDWQYGVWSNTHSTRPGAAGDLLAATLLAQPFTPSPPKPLPQPEGGGDRNAIPLYALPNCRVVHHFLPQMPLRVSALRSLGAYANVFAIESFMDELARAAGADPVAFRLRHMTDERARDVMRGAAERFGWAAYPKQPGKQPGQPDRGRGFAFARYKNLAGYAAIACEVQVHRDSGTVRVLRVVAVVDSGEVVNPDGIRNQIEGGIVQSLSWTTVEQVGYDARGVTSIDWGGYPILRFPDVPQRVEVHIIDRPGQPFLGTGEVAQGPTAAAIANAVADATGVRVRDLPLSRSRLRAALGP